MGAGQIGGIAALLDIDFENAAGFIGSTPVITEAQYIVYYLSHAMLFCTGALIEAHVILTPASCVFGERYKFDVFGGTHRFLEYAGVGRTVQNLCIHKGYNHTIRWKKCSPDNLALLVLNKQFSFRTREHGSEFILNRIRYGVPPLQVNNNEMLTCRFYGWGSRRNGYLIPLLIYLRRVEMVALPSERCDQMWNNDNKYLCFFQPICKSEKHGTLCPDDLGTVIECKGFAQGMMTSRLIDRPCGVGFIDLGHYKKFMTCGVDDSREVVDHSNYMSVDSYTIKPPTPLIVTVSKPNKGK